MRSCSCNTRLFAVKTPRRSREIREIHFYWSIGLLFLMLRLISYKKVNRWVGVALVITAFAEFEYWTSPTFFGTGVREYDRLLANKLALTAVSLALLVFAIWLWGVFRDEKTGVLPRG